MRRCILSKFYIKPQQRIRHKIGHSCCILSKFYIKPQLMRTSCIRSARCILSKFYIKPQQRVRHKIGHSVVSYRNSTSNHNGIEFFDNTIVLYLIEILHQTTTPQSLASLRFCCILSKFYIKPQLRHHHSQFRSCCILSKFYIKPQLIPNNTGTAYSCILSKFYIKPQQRIRHKIGHSVVSYRNSTSNHNSAFVIKSAIPVVSYRNSTSNHNIIGDHNTAPSLYLIEILHQTTT